MKHRMVNSYCISKYCTCDPYMGFSIWNRFFTGEGTGSDSEAQAVTPATVYNKLVYLSNQLTSSLYTPYILYTWGSFRIQYQIQIGALSTRHSQNLHTHAESIQWFTEVHASSSSYDLSPRPTSTPPPVSKKLSLFLGLPVCRWSSLLTGKGVGRWWERSQIIRRTARKPGPL